MTPTIRMSPVHDALLKYRPIWKEFGDARIAWQYDSVENNGSSQNSLGLCDLSPLSKLGVKGPIASTWLEDQGVSTPVSIYEALLFEENGWIVRIGTDELYLESGRGGVLLKDLDAKLKLAPPSVTRVERQEATFLITGSRALEVLAQTCAINFEEVSERQLVLTRVAGVSCSVLFEGDEGIPRYRIWVDPTYAFSLWDSLIMITEDLEGVLVGASEIYNK